MQKGKLIVNEERARALIEAMKQEAIVKLQNAAASDIKALADGRIQDMSQLARSAVANLGDTVETAGRQMDTAAQSAYNFAAGVSAILAAQGIDTSNITAGMDAILGSYGDVAKKIADLRIDYSSISRSSSGGRSSKVNFNDIWYQRYGRETYLYQKGEMDAEQYWEGFKKANDSILRDYGDDYLRDWRNRDLQWQGDGYKKERELLEESFDARVLTAQDYYTKLEALREKYFSESPMNNARVSHENRWAFYEAQVREFEDKLKVIEYL